MNKQQLITPDIIKGIAIIWVVAFHVCTDFQSIYCSDNSLPGDFFCRIITHGAIGVDLFVIISGFLLCRSCLNKKEIPWKRFLLKRCLRIFPLYLAAMASVLILQNAIGEGESLSVISVLVHAIGLHGLTPYIFDLQGAWWFITLILQLYIIFPFIWYLLNRFSMISVMVFSLLLTVVARFVPFANIDTNYSVFAFSSVFIMAIIWAKKISPQLNSKLTAGWIIYSLLAISLFIYGIYADSISVFSAGFGLYRPFVSFGIFILLCTLCNEVILKIKPITFIFANYGKYSYAIYLFHRPLIYKFVSILSQTLPPITILFIFIAIVLPMGYLLEKTCNKMLSYCKPPGTCK